MNSSCCNTPETAVQTSSNPAVEAPQRSVRRPRYRIDSSAEGHTVAVDLPGVDKASVKLAVEDGLLVLKAERTATLPESWKPLHRELSDAAFELRLRLNDRVDDRALTANLDDGVLSIMLPVKEAVKPRTIAIQ